MEETKPVEEVIVEVEAVPEEAPTIVTDVEALPIVDGVTPTE